jgi:hypothetical protein
MYNKTHYDMSNDILHSIDSYMQHGTPPGTFLRGVLTNDLRVAIFRADPKNLAQIKNIMLYVHNECPEPYWGSTEAVNNHIETKRIERELEREGAT